MRKNNAFILPLLLISNIYITITSSTSVNATTICNANKNTTSTSNTNDVLHTLEASTSKLTTMTSLPVSDIIETSNGKYDTISIEEAIHICDLNNYCSGISHESNNNTLHVHSIPPQLSNTTSANNSYPSMKQYILHKGRINKGKVLSYAHNNMTINNAQTYCIIHPNCIAFVYPTMISISSTESNILKPIPDNITFISSINEIQYTSYGNHDWYTYVINNSSKLRNNINISTFEIDIMDMINDQYPKKCCANSQSKTSRLPTMEEIQEVDTVFPRISCNITREEFYSQYESKRIPVMLVGCDDKWDAKTTWNFTKRSFFEKFDNQTTFKTRYGNNAIDWEYIPWYKIINAISNKIPFYIFDPLDHYHGTHILSKDYNIPNPISKNADMYSTFIDFPTNYVKNGYKSLLWWCVTNGNSGTYPHLDPIASDAWNSVLYGYKWWIIFNNNTINDSKDIDCCGDCKTNYGGGGGGLCDLSLDENDDDFENDNDSSVTNWFTNIGINVARYFYPSFQNDNTTKNNNNNPSFQNENVIHILQSPGETIYIPAGYVHSVFNIHESIAITSNFGSMANMRYVWEEIGYSGNERHYKQAYYNFFNKEQRKLAREANKYL